MAEYYKYAERSADSEVNWAQVGAETSGMLLEVNRVRQEKKDALEQAQRESINNLMNSPQGKNQDLNGVVNKFAHDMIEQKKIDYDLFKRGQINVKDYTLKVQNQMDGTNNLFNITKSLQDVRQTTFDGIADGSLQSAGNIFNKGMVEKYSDMSKLGINVNSPDGSVNLGLYEDKIINGKSVRVLSENIATPNTILGMIAQTIPTFYTDKVTTDWVKNMGDKKAAVYNSATTAGAGTITEYLGPEYLSKLKDPVSKQIASDFNKSIDDLVDSKIGGSSNSYNLMGVITENLGKYDSTSFTYSKDEAKADENKILVKINQSTGQMDLDPEGANYKKMKKEAFDYVRGQIINKLDAEKKISTTSQSQLQETEEQKERARNKYKPTPESEKDAETATNMIGKLWYGNPNQVQSSIDYIKGLKNSKGGILFKDVIRDPKQGVTVVLSDGTKEKISFLDASGRPRSQEDFIASAGPLLVGQLDVSKSLQSGNYQKSAKFNRTSYGRGTTIEEFTLPTNVLSKRSQEAVSDVNNALPEGFTAEDIGGIIGNEVRVTSPNGAKYTVKTKQSSAAAATTSLGLEDFIKSEQRKIEESGINTTTNQGVGSKY